MRPSTVINRIAALAVAAVTSVLAQGGMLAFTSEDAAFAYETAAGLVSNCTPRNAGTPGAVRAAAWLAKRAGAHGLPARLDRFQANVYADRFDFANVVAEMPGTDPKTPWIILLSHFDTAPNVAAGFQGANDGASTCGLLMALGRVLRRESRRRMNVMLVWTDGEECRIAYMPRDGFQGSKHLLETVRTRRLPVKAVICLDMLGDRDLNVVVPSNSSPGLKAIAQKAADAIGAADWFSLRETIAVKDDHSAFFDAGYPAIDLIDFEFGSAPGKNDYWHTPKDTLDKISKKSLFHAGRLVVGILDRLMQ